MNIRMPLISAVILAAPVIGVAQMPAVRITIDKAKLIEAPASMTLVGTVYPRRTSTVASEIEGIVRDMPARQGDHVEPGAVLCKLNDDVLTFQLAKERADLERLRAKHQELVAGTRKEEVARLKALRDEADSEYDRWKFEMDRVKRLYERGDSNDKEYQDTHASFQSAERRKIAADASYDEAVAGPRVETIAQAAHEVAAQEAVVKRLESDLEKTSIRAPYEGFVSQRHTEVGEWVEAGGQVVDLVDLSRVLVRADAPESILRYLEPGAASRVWIDALGRSFEGKIKHIIRSADVTARTFPVEVEVQNDSGLLAGGQFARVTVPSGAAEKVVAVPKDSIVERDNISSIALLIPGRDGKWNGILAPVTLGIDTDDWITVTSGNVRPGATVVVRGTERIMPFPTPVIVVDEDGTPVKMPPPPGAPSGPPQGREAGAAHGKPAEAKNEHGSKPPASDG